MKRLSLCIVLLALVYVLSVSAGRNTAHGQDAPPTTQNGGGNNAGGPDGGGPGGPGGGNGGRQNGPPGGFHLIPRFAMAKLDLTDDQKTQIAALEKETKTKLAAILTADQMKTLETARPPMGGRGGGQNGRGGQGGGPNGGQGGGQGQDGPPDGPPGGGQGNSGGGQGGNGQN